ncbi:C2H2-type domain-containing protein [Citrus sinensis]|uniref:C2H2-type domain-containing protein n=1 Tax=Citrus sinensis TaxID=2711 RepID=A0ACB8ME03_CITSI|nr:C2H2-type domain-containing protein [Citrus sinensis]
MAKTTVSIGSFFYKFLSLFLLLLHLGCFIFPSNNNPSPTRKKRKASPLSPSPYSPSRLKTKPHNALSSSWSYLKRIFSNSKTLKPSFGNSSICNQTYCSVCGIIKSGFSPKLDGISTLSSSWRAHVAIPKEIEEEFKFMNLKRAMLVCRVVAGRVGCDADDDVDMAKENGGFDSVIGRGAGGVNSRVDDDEELLVFNPRAVLPCFVIVYTV